MRQPPDHHALDLFEDCQRRWPGVKPVSSEALAAEAEGFARIRERARERQAEWLFCLAARTGDPAALHHLDDWISRLLGPWFRRVRFPEPLRDEARQLVRCALLGIGREGKLKEFEASGPLDRWLQVVAVRTALNVLRASQAAAPPAPAEDLAEAALGIGGDPEALLLSGERRALLKKAFAQALGTLDSRARLLLSLRYVHGTPVNSIATLLKAHRVSASRWLGDAEAKLASALRKALSEQGADADAAPLSEWITSRPDLSLSRLFRL